MLDDVIELVVELLELLFEILSEAVFHKKTPQEKKEIRQRKAQKRKAKARRKAEKQKEKAQKKKEKQRLKGKQPDPLITAFKMCRKWSARRKRLKKELAVTDEEV